MRDALRRVEPVDAGDEAARALRALMETKVTAVPVLEQGRLFGILSQLDLARGVQLKELEATPPPGALTGRAVEAGGASRLNGSEVPDVGAGRSGQFHSSQRWVPLNGGRTHRHHTHRDFHQQASHLKG